MIDLSAHDEVYFNDAPHDEVYLNDDLVWSKVIKTLLNLEIEGFSYGDFSPQGNSQNPSAFTVYAMYSNGDREAVTDYINTFSEDSSFLTIHETSGLLTASSMGTTQGSRTADVTLSVSYEGLEKIATTTVTQGVNEPAIEYVRLHKYPSYNVDETSVTISHDTTSIDIYLSAYVSYTSGSEEYIAISDSPSNVISSVSWMNHPDGADRTTVNENTGAERSGYLYCNYEGMRSNNFNVTQLEGEEEMKYGDLTSVDFDIKQSTSDYLYDISTVLNERGVNHVLNVESSGAFDAILNDNLNIPIVFGCAAADRTVVFSILSLGTSILAINSKKRTEDGVVAIRMLTGKIESFSYNPNSSFATLTVNYRPIIE